MSNTFFKGGGFSVFFVNMYGIKISADTRVKIDIRFSNCFCETRLVSYLNFFKCLAFLVHTGKNNIWRDTVNDSAMKITHRTFFYHVGVAGALIALLFFITGRLNVIGVDAWVRINFPILLFWLVYVAVTGALADYLVRKRRIQMWLIIPLSSVAGKSPLHLYRIYKKEGAGQKTGTKVTGRLLLKWGGCSRCVAWWVGGVGSFLIHLFYWPRWFGAIYFGALGASLTAALATGIYLARIIRRRLR